MFGLSNFIITEFLLIFYLLVTNVLYSYIIFSLIIAIYKEIKSANYNIKPTINLADRNK